MRRAFVLWLVLGTILPGLLRGQGTPRVHVAVSLREDSAGRTQQPVLKTEDLIADPRVAAMLASGFPLRLHYRLQVWRSRTLLDAQIKQTEWDVVVRHEPLLDQYQVAEVFRLTQRAYRYAGKDELARGIAIAREIRVGPTDAGEYYYIATLDVTTLTDSDIRELEQFLSGDVGPAATGSQPIGTAVANAVRRILLSAAGLPTIEVEGRSGKFSVQ